MQKAVPRRRSSRQEAGPHCSNGNSSDVSEGHDESPGFTAHWDLAGTETQPPTPPQPLHTIKLALKDLTSNKNHAGWPAEQMGQEGEGVSMRQLQRQGSHGNGMQADHQGADQRQLAKSNISRRESSKALTHRASNACAESSAYPALTYSAFPQMSVSDAGNSVHPPLPPPHHHTHATTMPHNTSFPPPRPVAPIPPSHIKFASVADWLLPVRASSKSGNEDEHENSDEDHESQSTGRASSALPLTRQTTVTISPAESRAPSRLHSVSGLPSASLLLGIWPQRSGKLASSASGSTHTAATAAAAAVAEALAAEEAACSSLVLDMVRSADGMAASDDEDSSCNGKGRRRSLPSSSQVPMFHSQSLQSQQQQKDRLQQDSLHQRKQRHTGGYQGSSRGHGLSAGLDSGGERHRSPSGYSSSKPSQTGSSSRTTSCAGTATATSTATGLIAAGGVPGSSADLETLIESGELLGDGASAVLLRSGAAPAPPLHSIITSAFSSFSSDAPAELSLPGAFACGQHPAYHRSHSQTALHTSTLQQQQKRLRKLQRFASTPVVDGRRPVLPLSPTQDDEDNDSRRSSFCGSRAASAMFALDANYSAADSHASLRFSLGMSMGKHEQLFPSSGGVDQPSSPLRAAAPRKVSSFKSDVQQLQQQQQQKQHTLVPMSAVLAGSRSVPAPLPAMVLLPSTSGSHAIPKHLTIPRFARQSAPQTAWGGWEDEGEEETLGQVRSTSSATAPDVSLEAAARAAAQADSSEYLEMDYSIPMTPPVISHKGSWPSRLWKKSSKKTASGAKPVSIRLPTLSEPSSSDAAATPTSEAHPVPVQRTTRNKIMPATLAAASTGAPTKRLVDPKTLTVATTSHATDASASAISARPTSTSPSTHPFPPPPLRPSFFALLSSAHILGSSSSSHTTTPRPRSSPCDPHPPSLGASPPHPTAGNSSTAGGHKARRDLISGELDPHPHDPFPSNHSHSRSGSPPGPVYLPFDHPQHDLLCACARASGQGDGRDSGNAARLTGGAGTRRNAAVDYSRVDPLMDKLSIPSNRSSIATALRELHPDGGRTSNSQRERTSDQWLQHKHGSSVCRDSVDLDHGNTLLRSLQSEPMAMLSQGTVEREIFSEPLAREWRHSTEWTPSQSGSLVSSSGAVRQAAIPSTESALESMLYECMHPQVPASPRSSLHYLSSVAQQPRGAHPHQPGYMMRQNQGLSLDTSSKRSALLHCTTFPHALTDLDDAIGTSSDEEKAEHGFERDSMAEGQEESEEDCEVSERPPQSQLQVLPRPLPDTPTLSPKKTWWKPWVSKPHKSSPTPTANTNATAVGSQATSSTDTANRTDASRAAATASLPQGSLDSVLFVGAVQQVRQALQTPRPAHARARSHHPQLPMHPRQPLILRMPLGGAGMAQPLPHTLSSSQINHLTTADALLAAAVAGAGTTQDAEAGKQGSAGKALSGWMSRLPSWGRRKGAK